MNRWAEWAILGIVCCLFAGCQGAYGPFSQPPARIPPPPTGSVGRTDPYYQPRYGANSAYAAQANSTYSARANTRQARERFTSDQQRATNRQPDRIDTSLDPVLDRSTSENILSDPSLSNEPLSGSPLSASRISSARANTTRIGRRPGAYSINEDLPWRNPYDSEVMTASGYSRPRPRFSRY